MAVFEKNCKDFGYLFFLDVDVILYSVFMYYRIMIECDNFFLLFFSYEG